MWELMWKRRQDGQTVTETATGLRSLAECRSELRNAMRKAKLDGADVVGACAYMRASAGRVLLAAER